ncbi:MAG: hypothetical protein ACK4KV_19010 [Rhodocyclaceae bacterium]
MTPAMNRAFVLDLVADLIAQGADRVGVESRERALGLALVRYDFDRPRVVVEDVTAPGGLALPWPASWDAARSVLRAIESPVERMPPAELETDQWGVYRAPTGPVLRVAPALPAGQVARLSFTVPHVLTDDVCTVPLEHAEALACYTAGTLCEQIATSHADNMDATIGADRVDQSSPAREWGRRANSLRNRYFAVLGISASGGTPAAKPVSASAVADMDLTPSFGKPFLYPRGRR